MAASGSGAAASSRLMRVAMRSGSAAPSRIAIAPSSELGMRQANLATTEIISFGRTGPGATTLA